MTAKTYVTITTVIFGIVAIVHLLRVAAGWSVMIDGWTVPMWASWLGFFVAAGLAFVGARHIARL